MYMKNLGFLDIVEEQVRDILVDKIEEAQSVYDGLPQSGKESYALSLRDFQNKAARCSDMGCMVNVKEEIERFIEMMESYVAPVAPSVTVSPDQTTVTPPVYPPVVPHPAIAVAPGNMVMLLGIAALAYFFLVKGK